MVWPTWIACQCFGISAEDCRLHGPQIHRAAQGSNTAVEVRQKLSNPLYSLFRSSTSPVALSRAAGLSDEIIPACLSYYRRLQPLVAPGPKRRKQWNIIFIEFVLLPTVVAQFELTRTDNKEFSPASDSWYVKNDVTPFEIAVDEWLRAAGLITAAGVARHRKKRKQGSEHDAQEDDALRKRVERWRSKTLPKRGLKQLFEDVEQTRDRLRGQTVNEICGRLLLGFAIQKGMEFADKVKPAWSKHLKERYLVLAKEPFVCTKGYVAEPSIQFALRLIRDRFVRSGWRPKAIEISTHGFIADGEGHDRARVFEELELQAYRASPAGQFHACLNQHGMNSGVDSERDWIAFEDFLVTEAVTELKRLAGSPASRD
jgi:hypothetical protein